MTAGTVVVSGRLVVRAAETGEDTQLAHLIALVEQAQADKSPSSGSPTGSAACSSRRCWPRRR